jgi:hypothetical protein
VHQPFFFRAGLVRSSIVWQNVPDAIADPQAVTSVVYSDVQGGFTGAGNIDADPRFCDAIARDFHLRPNSPCIDTGDPTLPPDPNGSVADMGAYTFDVAHCSQPQVYCTAKVNSLGCAPSMRFNGTPSATMSSGFMIKAVNVLNNKVGLLFHGVSGPASQPFQAGTLCVGSPIRRTPAVFSNGTPPPVLDCTGIYAMDFNAFASGALGGNPLPALTVPGTQVHAQWWGRDPGFVAPLNTTLSDGLTFYMLP